MDQNKSYIRFKCNKCGKLIEMELKTSGYYININDINHTMHLCDESKNEYGFLQPYSFIPSDDFNVTVTDTDAHMVKVIKRINND